MKCSDYHELKTNPDTGFIIPDPACLCCQANSKFVKRITEPNITQEEYDAAVKEYRQARKRAQ